MRVLRLLILAVGLMLIAAPASAVEPDEVLSDQALEERARQLSAKLRCLVCQNQSIDDSDAPLARDLRLLLRERLTKGDSDKQVIDYLVGRYGEFILLQPKFGIHTLALWLGPFVLLACGIWFIWRRRSSARTSAPVAETPLSEQEAAELKRLMADDN